MLRVDASNLPNPRGLPRSRRLLPKPPAVPDAAALLAASADASAPERHEFMLPPPDASASPELELPEPPTHQRGPERWSVRLELGDEDIAKLYGQGMARGAVVWRKGMVEWRPLLITPELSELLRRTRTTLTSSVLPPELAERAVSPTTVAPTAMDVAPPSTKPRRSLELAAVACAAFALAWVGHGKLSGPRSADTGLASLPSVVTKTAACEPAPVAAPVAAPQSTIPLVALTDLPLVGASASTTDSSAHATGHRSSGHAGSADGSGPSRGSLVSALSRVAQSASGCGERGGPVRVVMSFSPSGVARSIQVSGGDLPASTRSCIIGAASRARVPAFSGDPVTVSKTL